VHDSDIAVHQVLYLREVRDEKARFQESSTQTTDFLHLHPHPIARHTRDSHAVVDFFFTVPTGQPDLLKRKAPRDHREVLPDAISWSVLEGSGCTWWQLCHIFGIEPSFGHEWVLKPQITGLRRISHWLG
jgi:hypothetical protein